MALTSTAHHVTVARERHKLTLDTQQKCISSHAESIFMLFYYLLCEIKNLKNLTNFSSLHTSGNASRKNCTEYVNKKAQ